MTTRITDALRSLDHPWGSTGYATRFQGFHNLMRFNVSDILLVSSLYDSYILEEDGRLYESIRREYEGLNLSHSPELTHVSSGHEALQLASGGRFDLIITTLHIQDMHATRFAKKLRESGLTTPLVLLAYDNREQSELMLHHETSLFDRIFIWQGDYRMMLGIIKDVEDRINVEHDTSTVGVQSIILIEDNVRYYSAFLPIIYTEILNQSQRLLVEGINLSDRYLRMRARPKILLCTTYEEAEQYFNTYSSNILGIISDIDFLRGGVHDPKAGIEFARAVRSRYPDIPILLQSNAAENAAEAHAIGVSFLMKESPTLLNDLRKFMAEYFSFGDFVFRLPHGEEVARAADLTSLEEQLQKVPEESIVYHAQRNHFSNWLKARTEFWLAHKLRPRKVTDYSSPAELRDDLIASLRSYKRSRQLGQITEFSKATFDATSSFARIGGGSLGGKARGLGFVNTLINNFDIGDRFEGVEISIPPAVILGTDVFDTFLDKNGLRDFALLCEDDAEITRRFVDARKFPRKVRQQLAEFLDLIREPLAVRSSTLLEDSQYHPFAGVYETFMIPNNDPDPDHRLNELITTIKHVYASTFYRGAKDYIRVTSYRLEEEKMAVVIQKMVGAQHGSRFYPDVSGVARSYNYYPVPPQKSGDGIASAALGLGRTIVEGGETVRFCPKYPQHIPQFFSTEQTLRNSQTEFYALDLSGKPPGPDETHDILLLRHPLSTAEEDGTLHFVGSTYSADNEAITDGLSRSGRRVVTLAPILRNKIFPLPQVLELLLDLGSWGMGAPVEIEFAVSLYAPPRKPKQFGLLQMRPLVTSREVENLHIDISEPDRLVCYSQRVLGHGISEDIRDVILVDVHAYDRSKSLEVAHEVSQFNHRLVGDGKPYLLVGVGRWGSSDPWLGIPVKWDQISGARAIVEAGFKDFTVTPSQGSHFFQNIISFMVSYFTVTDNRKEGFLDWEWLLAQTPAESRPFTRHLRFERPLIVKVNAQQNKGVILKPE
jgi:CheY-like chemotaxis protein